MASVFIVRNYEDVIAAESGRPRQAGPVSSDRPASERDGLMVACLTGVARRHAPGRTPTEAETAAAVAELAEIAGDRGDLLAEVAGLLLGYYRHTAEQARAEAAARYCIAAGADLDLIPQWMKEGRRRAAAAQRAPGTATAGCEDSPGRFA